MVRPEGRGRAGARHAVCKRSGRVPGRRCSEPTGAHRYVFGRCALLSKSDEVPSEPHAYLLVCAHSIAAAAGDHKEGGKNAKTELMSFDKRDLGKGSQFVGEFI